MYHPYSRPGSPSLPNPLLDRALQHRGGSEAKSDSTMAAQGQSSMNPGRSRKSGSPHAEQKGDLGEGMTSPKMGRGGESSTNVGASPRMGTIDEGEGYRNGSSRGNALPPMRRSRSPASMAYPDSRGGSPPQSRYRRTEADSYSSRTHRGMAENPHPLEHTSSKRCSDCGRPENEVGLILPLTEEGGKQYCKGCCKSVLVYAAQVLIVYSYSRSLVTVSGTI